MNCLRCRWIVYLIVFPFDDVLNVSITAITLPFVSVTMSFCVVAPELISVFVLVYFIVKLVVSLL